MDSFRLIEPCSMIHTNFPSHKSIWYYKAISIELEGMSLSVKESEICILTYCNWSKVKVEVLHPVQQPGLYLDRSSIFSRVSVSYPHTGDSL